MSFKTSDFSHTTQLSLLLKVIVIILLFKSACSTNAVKWDICGIFKVKIKSRWFKTKKDRFAMLLTCFTINWQVQERISFFISIWR